MIIKTTRNFDTTRDTREKMHTKCGWGNAENRAGAGWFERGRNVVGE